MCGSKSKEVLCWVLPKSKKNQKLKTYRTSMQSYAYLIFVKDAKDGVRVNFSARCKFFQKAKIYTVLCSNLTYSVPHSACNATNQCIILYFVCNLHDYTHLGVTQRCCLHNAMCVIFTEYVVFAPIHCYAAFTLNVCSFT